ncbi:hypothetical protein CHO01_24950 [Cellulomonas hominis]|uniref:Uncharacterized protein n=1 Tax=Cellulomonas hominis TaxID=156981 RepID=A0A511FDP1_9CELL|nr:hypothetical protein [Cellulomonas hominis]MBB5475076.1 hypothetical protein [Cellulomonas hominis]NKY05903.1 hypothetical protein [Cellulomonas hominis]GEL47379.1 hypothetical protein CHO01_24950 [Cellulomonas hominis]
MTTTPAGGDRGPARWAPAQDAELDALLRAWARGIDALEAATELLIRAGLAGPARPWVCRAPAREDRPAGAWIDFAAVSAYMGLVSPSERRVLLFAASLSDVDAAPAVRLGDLTRVGPRRLELLAAAVAHAGGRRDAWRDRARAGG